jgi:hypothetical protein
VNAAVAEEVRKAEARLARAREILSRHPELDFEDVWHALICLEMTPIQRLELALTRGRPWPDSR